MAGMSGLKIESAVVLVLSVLPMVFMLLVLSALDVGAGTGTPLLKRAIPGPGETPIIRTSRPDPPCTLSRNSSLSSPEFRGTSCLFNIMLSSLFMISSPYW
jgi:hypothetical protein